MQTIQEFLEQTPVHMGVELNYVESKAHFKFSYLRFHYWITLFTPDGKYIQVNYEASDPDPELADVLDCLANDCLCITGRSLTEFAQEFGHDNLIEASSVYHAIKAERTALIRMLGRSAYMQLVFKTERL